MSENIEIMKCYNPNPSLPICRECQRNGLSESSEYETFDLNKTLMNGWKCDGFLKGVGHEVVNAVFLGNK